MNFKPYNPDENKVYDRFRAWQSFLLEDPLSKSTLKLLLFQQLDQRRYIELLQSNWSQCVPNPAKLFGLDQGSCISSQFESTFSEVDNKNTYVVCTLYTQKIYKIVKAANFQKVSNPFLYLQIYKSTAKVF